MCLSVVVTFFSFLHNLEELASSGISYYLSSSVD